MDILGSYRTMARDFLAAHWEREGRIKEGKVDNAVQNKERLNAVI